MNTNQQMLDLQTENELLRQELTRYRLREQIVPDDSLKLVQLLAKLNERCSCGAFSAEDEVQMFVSGLAEYMAIADKTMPATLSAADAMMMNKVVNREEQNT